MDRIPNEDVSRRLRIEAVLEVLLGRRGGGRWF